MSIAEKLTTIAENEQKVYEAGQKSEYDRFWDSYQENGNRTSYAYAFAGWTADIFKPKYDIKPTASANYLFAHFGRYQNSAVDLKKLLADNNVILDISKATATTHLFSEARIDNIPTLDFRGCSAVWIFCANDYTTTIEKIILKETHTFQNAFQNAFALANITIEGVIGNNVDFKDCSKLTHDSLMSIINALKDFSGTETFANVDYRWDGNYPYEYNPKNDFVYNVKSASFSSGELQLFLETDTDLDLVLVANDINYSGDLSKIKTAMISSDGTLTLTFEPTTTKTLTLHAESKKLLTNAEIQSAKNKGWNVV